MLLTLIVTIKQDLIYVHHIELIVPTKSVGTLSGSYF